MHILSVPMVRFFLANRTFMLEKFPLCSTVFTVSDRQGISRYSIINSAKKHWQGCNCRCTIVKDILSHLDSCETSVHASACEILTQWRSAHIVRCLTVSLMCVVEIRFRWRCGQNVYVVSQPQVSCQGLSEQVSRTLITPPPPLHVLSFLLTSVVPCRIFYFYDVSVSYVSLIHFFHSLLTFSHFYGFLLALHDM